MTGCVCGSNKPAIMCCERFLSRESLPKTPEELMRSRYAAYVAEDADYLLSTWHTDTKPADISFEECRWLGLKVINTIGDGQATDEGWVKFVARYKVAGKAFRIEENSYFVRRNGQWLYVDGGSSK